MEKYLLVLNKYFYHNPIQLRRILEGFKDLEKIMEAPRDAFFNLGVSGKTLDNFLKERHSYFDKSKTDSNNFNFQILTILDKEYPEKLKHLCDAPPILFYRGDINCLNEEALSVIGSRKISEYGRRVCENLVKGICNNFIIISGLAYGVDALAHKITVQHNQKTIAVLGSGLNNIYPTSNINLAEEIIQKGGLVLSECPLDIGPQRFHFPMRNRIIAGLSRGILIIEGGKKSGTLITAKLGIDYGADIFAVPNSIFQPNSEGVNYLIKCGAHPITSKEDILGFYGIEAKKEKQAYTPKNDLERKILKVFSGELLHTDEIKEKTKLDIMQLMETITDLEMRGILKNIGGGKYERV